MMLLLKIQVPEPHPETTQSGSPEAWGLGSREKGPSIPENVRLYGQGCLLETIRGKKQRPTNDFERLCIC